MFFLGIILITAGGWLVDCGVQGRHPISDIEALITTGNLPADAAVQVVITSKGKGGSAEWLPAGSPIPVNTNSLTQYDAHGNPVKPAAKPPVGKGAAR